MDCYTIRDLSFAYPQSGSGALKFGAPKPSALKSNALNPSALDGINITVKSGDFLVLTGKSGSGKTTLLRMLKPVLTPHGDISGSILFRGEPLDRIDLRRQTAIGFVMQNPDNQIVSDTVWHELAFGLENLGLPQETIRLRVAEMASYFGIEGWFRREVASLSGGQKQLLSLASVMAMQPDVLLLDEPTAQLDPIAAGDFLATVGRLHKDLGITVILTEHRLNEVLPLANRLAVLDRGQLLEDGTPESVGRSLREKRSDIFAAMPAPMQIYARLDSDLHCPITVRDGRLWLDNVAPQSTRAPLPKSEPELPGKCALCAEDIWFRYQKKESDILRGLSHTANFGQITAICGGNGAGKTTLLRVLGGTLKPYSGRVTRNGTAAILPQNPQTLFVGKTVAEDLAQACPDGEAPDGRIHDMAERAEILPFLDRHPYDLSGGEQQRCALAKVLLADPDILLLDEPTKALDAVFKRTLAGILRRLSDEGRAVVIVSHDLEFCAQFTDRCALLFDGIVVASGRPGPFFSGNSFYTTASNRMARHRFPDAVTVDDVAAMLRGDPL